MLNPFYIDSHHPDHRLYTSKSLNPVLYCQSYSAGFHLPAVAKGEMEENKNGLGKLNMAFYQRGNLLYCIDKCMMHLL